MSGHSKWHQIKHKKGLADKKRAVVFGKLLRAIQIAAREEPNPDFNPRLRSVIQKAKAEGVPQDNIERAISRAKEAGSEEVVFEVYGQGGTAWIIQGLTDSKNRLLNELKQLLTAAGAKLAEPGAVLWAFDQKDGEFQPKFKQSLSEKDQEAARELMAALEDQEEITEVFTNAEL